MKVFTSIGETMQGYHMYVEDNEVGGKRIWSDSIGGGVCVWDTSLVSPEELDFALDYMGHSRRTCLVPLMSGIFIGAVTVAAVVSAFLFL